jgi:hypothetical protein
MLVMIDASDAASDAADNVARVQHYCGARIEDTALAFATRVAAPAADLPRIEAEVMAGLVRTVIRIAAAAPCYAGPHVFLAPIAKFAVAPAGAATPAAAAAAPEDEPAEGARAGDHHEGSRFLDWPSAAVAFGACAVTLLCVSASSSTRWRRGAAVVAAPEAAPQSRDNDVCQASIELAAVGVVAQKEQQGTHKDAQRRQECSSVAVAPRRRPALAPIQL